MGGRSTGVCMCVVVGVHVCMWFCVRGGVRACVHVCVCVFLVHEHVCICVLSMNSLSVDLCVKHVCWMKYIGGAGGCKSSCGPSVLQIQVCPKPSKALNSATSIRYCI